MKKYLLSFLCAVLMISAATAQDVSEKQEVAVFSLNYTDWSIPTGALGMVDQQIVEVISNLGRFDVKGLNFRLRTTDISEFTEMIKKANESNIVIDEKYRLGEETFTEADFLELVGSFIIVIPSMTYYNAFYSEDGWEVELQTSFSFIKVKDSTSIAQFSIETFGSADTQQEATLNAAEAIAPQLEFELRSIEEFRLKTGIIEILPYGNVIIELGRNMGLAKGDEYSIISSSLLSSGHTVTDNSGLLVITDVKNEVSYGKVIYSDGKASVGDQLMENPRIGTDLSAYGHLFINKTGITGGSVGIKSAVSRGFYDMRPFMGVEFPIVSDLFTQTEPGFPMTLYLGGEFMWYLGRLQIEPSVSLGGTGLIPVNEQQSFRLTHAGGSAGLMLNWMFMDSMRLFLEGGYCYWFSMDSASASSYGGIFAGLGVTFKM